MSGNNGSDDKSQGNNGGGNGDEKKQEQGFKPVTYNTQEELDAAFAERATRAADSAKAEALKAFQEAGATPEEALEAWTKAKEAEEAKKDPAVKERERRERVERELQAYKDKEKREALSVEVAKTLKVGDTPIPASLLAGTTKEEMEAHGKAIIDFVGQLVGQGGRRPPAHNPLQGSNGEDKVAAGDPVRNFLTTGSFI